MRQFLKHFLVYLFVISAVEAAAAWTELSPFIGQMYCLLLCLIRLFFFFSSVCKITQNYSNFLFHDCSYCPLFICCLLLNAFWTTSKVHVLEWTRDCVLNSITVSFSPFCYFKHFTGLIGKQFCVAFMSKNVSFRRQLASFGQTCSRLSSVIPLFYSSAII